MLVTQGGQAIRFPETDARPMGRPAAGVIGIRLGPGDRVIASEVVDPEDDLLVVASKGLGKRTAIDEFRGQGRGGKGVTAMKLTPKTGHIVAAAMVHTDQEVAMISSTGQVIRIPVAQISRIGRATQGVQLMRVTGSNSVISATVVDAKSEQETQTGEVAGSLS